MDINSLLNIELLRLGDFVFSFGSIGLALFMLFATLIVAWLFRVGIDRLRKRSHDQNSSAFFVAQQFGRYVIFFIGAIAIGSALGLNLTSLSLFAGAIGVGIGFGIQDIVKDFLSGIILLLDKSIGVGDFVEVEDGVTGEVASIGARSSTILTNDNVDILIPNSLLLTGKLTNWTRHRATRRIHIPFSVAYGSDKEIVRMAAIEASQSVPFTMPDTPTHKTQVWLTGFGDSALNFELVVWPTLDAVKRPGSMMAAYFWALDDALKKHNLEIPFPQQDIRLRSFFGHEREEGLLRWASPNAIEKLSSNVEDSVAPPSLSQNDAAQDIVDQSEQESQ